MKAWKNKYGDEDNHEDAKGNNLKMGMCVSG